MDKFTRLDVLIVYNQSLAISASRTSAITPFSRRSRNQLYNTVYAYFLQTCQKFKLAAAFATSADIIGPGLCQSFWSFTRGHWIKNNSPCFSTLIFDKFSPTSKLNKTRRQLLFSSPVVKPFNDPDLFNLFFDKQKTYEKFSNHAIPTIPLKNHTLHSINHACQNLSRLMVKHPGSSDFTPDIIMKDRFGAGGRHVYKFNLSQSQNMLATARQNARVSYVIQPFAKFDRGFTYQNRPAPTDIRFIYLNGKIIQSYIRVARPNEFRCNEHQGGLLTYLSLNDIPATLIAKSNSIAKTLNKNCSLYSLDFIISNNGNSYLLEGNTGPGLDWNTSLKENEIESKKLIHLLVQELSLRAHI